MSGLIKFEVMTTLYYINWTAISAITSAVMAIITLITLVVSSCQNKKLRKQNDDQLEVVKKQWEEEQRPYLELALVKRSYSYGRYDLEIRNIGRTSAENISFSFANTFLEKITDMQTRNYFINLGQTEFKILPNEIKYFRMIENDLTSGRYYLGNSSVNRDMYDEIMNLLKANGVEIKTSYNKYVKSETLLLEETRHQTISQVEAINAVSFQIALLRTEIKQDSTDGTKQ